LGCGNGAAWASATEASRMMMARMRLFEDTELAGCRGRRPGLAT
jgi:hypothetical protein